MEMIDDVVRLALPPDLTLAEAARIKLLAQDAVARGGPILVDASAVSRVTTPGVQVLVSMALTVNAMGGTPVRIAAAPEGFSDVIVRLGLDALFHMEYSHV